MRRNPTLIAFTDVCATVQVPENVNVFGGGGYCVMNMGSRLGMDGVMF